MMQVQIFFLWHAHVNILNIELSSEHLVGDNLNCIFMTDIFTFRIEFDFKKKITSYHNKW